VPLPNAKRLHYPYPTPREFIEVERNFEESRIWANTLPFFPTYDYLVRPNLAQSFTSSSYVSMTGLFRDRYGATTTTNHPWSGSLDRNGGAPNGLRFPFQKQEDWTAVSVYLSMSAFYDPVANVSSQVNLRWKLGYIDTNITGFAGTDDLPPSNVPSVLGNGQYLAADMRFNVIGTFGVSSTVHLAIPPRTVLIPPHPRGWNFVELEIATSQPAIEIDTNDYIQVVIQETLPRPPQFEGDITQPS
jgi:hypothetical protein